MDDLPLQEKNCNLRRTETTRSSPQYHCANENCDKAYLSYSSLLFHYKQFAEHQPEVIERRRKVTAKEAIVQALPDNLTPNTRAARIKEFVKSLSDEECSQFLLPRLCKATTPAQFLLKYCEHSFLGVTRATTVLKEFQTLENCIYSRFPELRQYLNRSCSNRGSVVPSEVEVSKQCLDNMLQSSGLQVSKWFMDYQNGKLVRECLMPLLVQKHHPGLLDFFCGITENFSVSQKDLQRVLRNTLGRKLSIELGVNIVPPRDAILKVLCDRRQESIERVGLNFEDHDGIMVAVVNVKQYLQLLLSRCAITKPMDSILLLEYTDQAPWLRWSRHFTGLTSCRVKVVDHQNSLLTIITVAAYLGKDDYDTQKKCLNSVQNQLSDLVEIPPSTPTEPPIKVHLRVSGDGKQRRIATGSSSAKSSYPIPDAPEHANQLGDMTIICKKPVFVQEDSLLAEQEFNCSLKGKSPTKEKRREFAKLNFGRQGRASLARVDVDNYYVGTMHLGLRAAESLSIRIS